MPFLKCRLHYHSIARARHSICHDAAAIFNAWYRQPSKNKLPKMLLTSPSIKPGIIISFNFEVNIDISDERHALLDKAIRWPRFKVSEAANTIE